MVIDPLILPDEAATERLGEDIAMILRRGDTLCLHGDLGAGKSSLARALIRALADNDNMEVPSPTYTLCQSYDGDLPVSHFDLYRLASEDEVLELVEAVETGAVIVRMA
ncbi:MAG: tRNA (adenosine(37)-N6)-threonylcarbamoyltransferase complex ATPase subunit type 1 TsaE [Nitratireductor sp.]